MNIKKELNESKEDWRIYLSMLLFILAGLTVTIEGWWHWPVLIVLSSLGGRLLGKGIVKISANEFVEGYLRGLNEGAKMVETSMRGEQ